MRTKYALVVLSVVTLVLQSVSAWAAPGRELRPVWEEAVEPQASKIILQNLSAQPARASLGSTSITVSADGRTEVPAVQSGAGPLALRSDAALLVLQVPDELDARSLAIETSGVGRTGPIFDKLLLQLPPEWTRDLAAGGAHVHHGETGRIKVASGDPAARVEVAVELVAPHTRVRIRQLDKLGNEVTSLVASASRPIRWRATLAPVGGESWIEMQTLRGEAQGTATATGKAPRGHRPRILPTKSGGGLAGFSPEINWDGNPSMTYDVTGAPASTCGDLYASRNFGSYTVTPNWICTDASGNASAGPYYYSSQTADEDAFAYILWSNGFSTNTSEHIWDVYGPSASITSSNGPPAPTSFSGTATDPTYGAGFSSSWGSYCVTYFYDLTAGWYWQPGGFGYSSQFPYNGPNCTISGMPSHSVTWSEGQLPPGSDHFSHHCYEWGVVVYESTSSSKSGWDYMQFCIP
jgi:hypothetical protein